MNLTFEQPHVYFILCSPRVVYYPVWKVLDIVPQRNNVSFLG